MSCHVRPRKPILFGLISVTQDHEWKLNYIRPWGDRRWRKYESEIECKHCRVRVYKFGISELDAQPVLRDAAINMPANGEGGG
jgi:hypothetical protein